MSTNLAAGSSAAAAGAAGVAAGAACAAAGAALLAAVAACTVACSTAKCCTKVSGAVRTPHKRTAADLEQQQETEAVLVPVTARTLESITSDDKLLTSDRASEHVLHAIAEANEQLITPGIVARIGWDSSLTRHGAVWELAGHRFTISSVVAGAGVATVATAPLSVPSNAVAGAGFVATQGVSLLWGAKGEINRGVEQEAFLSRYGLRKEDLKWSVVPVATLYWNLMPGDTILEICLKAKRGLFGLADLGNADDHVLQLKLRRLLCKLLDCMPGAASERAMRVDQAIRKAALDMGGGLEPTEPARVEPMEVAGTETTDAAAGVEPTQPRNPWRVARLEVAFRLAAANMGHPEVSRALEGMAQLEA